jgi:NAD(P)H dehydrogenase (quinone)
MPRLLIINGHPDGNPDDGSLTNALCDAYEEAARAKAGDAEVTRIDLRALRFDPILHRGYAAPQPLEPDLARAAAAIVAARHVTWFYPCWWNAPPALVKGFLDRVLTPGFAFRYDEAKALPEKLLTGRSARFVTSMDSPWLWHVLVNGSALHVQLRRSTLGFCGFSPVRGNTFYSARKMTAADRERALGKMRKVAARDALTALSRPRSSAVAPAVAA